MRINKSAIGKCCPTCLREVDLTTVEKFMKMRSQRKAIKDKKVGRPRFRDDERIVQLRNLGHPLEQIAVMTGLSVATVLRGLK